MTYRSTKVHWDENFYFSVTDKEKELNIVATTGMTSETTFLPGVFEKFNSLSHCVGLIKSTR